MALQISSTAARESGIAMATLSLTIKDIRLNLLPRILQFVESIICVLSNHTVLHGTHNGDENIVLQNYPNTVSVSQDFLDLATEFRIKVTPPILLKLSTSSPS